MDFGKKKVTTLIFLGVVSLDRETMDVESTEQRKVTNPRVRGLLLEKIVVFELTKKRSQVNCADKIGISKLGKKG